MQKKNFFFLKFEGIQISSANELAPKFKKKFKLSFIAD